MCRGFIIPYFDLLYLNVGELERMRTFLEIMKGQNGRNQFLNDCTETRAGGQRGGRQTGMNTQQIALRGRERSRYGA